MQALSQLSYGPALLRAGNHSDISTSWEVICTRKVVPRRRCHLPGQSQGRTYGVRRSSRGARTCSASIHGSSAVCVAQGIPVTVLPAVCFNAVPACFAIC
ncbi:hypothetical protein EYR26_10930 [Xanthomonas oryzae]|nr:hypothetical protein EYR26_10930 [Xanthomonas oryzae]